MNILISESQYRIILTESIGSELKDISKSTIEYAKSLKKRVMKDFGVSFRFLITWGSAIGGLGKPLEDFLRGENPELTDVQITKIMVAALAMIYYNNKEEIKDLYNEIKGEGLLPVLKKAVSKGNTLMKVFKTFMGNLATMGHQFADIMSYTFLIPLVGYLDYMYKDEALGSAEIKDIVTRLLASGAFIGGGNMIKDILTKIVKDLNSTTEKD
jgi:hypothetical protein